MRADDIPVAHTPPGLWTELPPPVLGDCTEPLAADAPDLRGTWRAVQVERGGELLPAGSPELDHVERIEQCGDRVVVTSHGVIHDMRADGVPEHGVHDVSAIGQHEIHVTASFEDQRLVLRPEGIPVEVVRWREGDQLVWAYGPAMTTWMERIDP